MGNGYKSVNNNFTFVTAKQLTKPFARWYTLADKMALKKIRPPSARLQRRAAYAVSGSANRGGRIPLPSCPAERKVSRNGCSRYRARKRRCAHRKQGGTVECLGIPPLNHQGWDVFLPPQIKKGGNSHERRKHLFL